MISALPAKYNREELQFMSSQAIADRPVTHTTADFR